MAFRIAHSPAPVRAKPVKKPQYLDFIRKLPCCVTGTRPVDAAHLSMASPRHGHFGRGKSQKASDRWTLPLCREEHDKQHVRGETDYWLDRTKPDPHILCLVLWGLWNERGESEALELAERILSTAERSGPRKLYEKETG